MVSDPEPCGWLSEALAIPPATGAPASGRHGLVTPSYHCPCTNFRAPTPVVQAHGGEGAVAAELLPCETPAQARWPARGLFTQELQAPVCPLLNLALSLDCKQSQVQGQEHLPLGRGQQGGIPVSPSAATLAWCLEGRSSPGGCSPTPGPRWGTSPGPQPTSQSPFFPAFSFTECTDDLQW